MRTALAAVVTCLALISTACGGSDEGTQQGAADLTTSTEAESVSDPVDDSAVSTTTTIPVTTTTPTPTTTPEETTTTTTVAPANPLPAVPLTDLPGIVTNWETGTGEPLDLARRLIGFPLEIGPPAGASPATVDLRVWADDPVEWRWEWAFEAFMPDGSVQEVDADLPEGGPGTIEGRLYYDPLFEAFGWRNVAQVISDPSSGGGGPQSVNWAYETDGPLTISGVDSDPIVGRAWVDEDIGFGSADATPGHRIEVDARVPAGAIPVPLMEALLAALPPLGGDLTKLDLRSWERLPDSFDADFGLRYLQIDLEWVSNQTSPGAAGIAFIAGLDGVVLQEGEASFVNEGEIEVREPIGDGVERWQQRLLLLDRYLVRLDFQAGDDSVVTGELEIRLEANRPVLSAPGE